MTPSIESDRSKFIKWTMFTGFVIGLAGVLLLWLGNPPNMGICGACFIRDVSGGLLLFSKPETLQYLRPEIPAFVMGAFIAALVFGEFRSRGGASPAIRFVLGAFMMIGSLVFLGCPIRLIARLGGGDFICAGMGLLGLLFGIATASILIKKGFSLGQGRDQSKPAALFMPLLALGLLGIILTILLTGEDSKGILTTKRSAPIILAFWIALIVGFYGQRSRFCSTGGYRDLMLTGEFRLMWGYIVLFATLTIGNLIFGQYHPGAAPVAHTEQVWNFLGLYLVGMCAVMAGGCPFRQLIAAGQGNTDAGITVMGLVFGAAFCHNFHLAAKPVTAESAGGPDLAGMVAVAVGILVCISVGIFCREQKNSI